MNKALQEQKVKGRRIIIEESDGSESMSEDEQNAEVTKNGEKQSQAVVNGHENVSTECKETDADKMSDTKQALCDQELKSSPTPKVEQTPKPEDKPKIASPTSVPVENKTIESEKPIASAESKPSIADNSKPSEHVENKPAVAVAEPPAPPPPLPDAVQFLKTKGNDLFKSGQYGDAIGVYDKAIKKLETGEGVYNTSFDFL